MDTRAEALTSTKAKKSRYDAIVVGGGHNGLVCAAYLAKAGKDVLVLERRHVLGGAAVSEEIYPGFTYSVCSYVVSLFRPQIIRELELAKHGLDLIPLEASFLPLHEGEGLCRWSDPHLTRREVERFSKRDAETLPEFSKAMSQLARVSKSVIDQPAPDPTSLDPRELMKLLRLGREMQDLDPDLQYLNHKLLTMSAVDFLDPSSHRCRSAASSGPSSASAHRGAPMCCSTTTWGRSTGPSAPGASHGAGPAR